LIASIHAGIGFFHLLFQVPAIRGLESDAAQCPRSDVNAQRRGYGDPSINDLNEGEIFAPGNYGGLMYLDQNTIFD
jgi:hypothetical protein